MAPCKNIKVREVWQTNLEDEFCLINDCIDRFPIVSMDTEYPGTVFHPTGIPKQLLSSLSPPTTYAIMKQNVDALKLIQLGLTLSDANGNLPDFGTKFQYYWQFNFREFDPELDPHNPDSISLLERQGIDFVKNKEIGIDCRHFAWLFMISGLGLNSFRGKLTWVTFLGSYDFAYLIKILTRRKLPGNLAGFRMLVRHIFGPTVYDAKFMIRFYGLHGGLDQVSKALNMERVAGKSHQAGSDSLLTMEVFLNLGKRTRCCDHLMKGFNHKLHGLT